MKFDLTSYKGPIEFPKEMIVLGQPKLYAKVEKQGNGLVQVRAAVLEEPYKVMFKDYPYDVFIHVLKGTLILTSQDETVQEVHPGECYFLPQGSTHMLELKLEDGLYLEDVLINKNDLLKHPNVITSLLQL